MLKPVEGIEQFKEFLGQAAQEYSNAELLQLQKEMHAMAELLLDISIYKRKRPEKTTSTNGFDNFGGLS
jgi:hypothetical protein